MIDLNGANSYFAAHTAKAKWREYSTEQKDAAILMAKRDLSRALQREMDENEDPYTFGDSTRDEYAVYEQALYILLRDVNPEVTGVAVPSLDPVEKKDQAYSARTGNGKWSEEALAWLGARGCVQVVQS